MSERIHELEEQVERLGRTQNSDRALINDTWVNQDNTKAVKAAEGAEDDYDGEKPVDVVSSCSSKLAAQASTNNVENGNHFNAFANSFHVTDKVRVSMSLPKLTEDMLKINQELHAISA